MPEISSKLPAEGTPSSKPTTPQAAAPNPSLRVAVSSSTAETARRWIWMVTVILILGAGWVLYVLRASIAPALDDWLPSLQRASPPPVIETLEVQQEPAVVEEPAEPVWTYVEIETAIAPLPEAVDALITAGLKELPEFSGLDSSDETRVLLVRNRWGLWGRIWLNRVDQLESQMPPIQDCEIHAALEPTCRALVASLAALIQVPAADRLEAAKESFAEAAGILEALRNPPEELLEEAASGSVD